MGNTWQNWRSAFNLDPDHFLVKNYRKKTHHYPHLALFINLILILITLTCTVFWQIGGIHYQILNEGKKDLFFDFFIWAIALCIIYTLWFILDAICSPYVRLMTKIAGSLNWIAITNANESQLKSAAVSSLRLIASLIKEEEKVAKDYWPELVRLRHKFKSTYDTFVQAGLIQDAGYRFYFEEKKNK